MNDFYLLLFKRWYLFIFILIIVTIFNLYSFYHYGKWLTLFIITVVGDYINNVFLLVIFFYLFIFLISIGITILLFSIYYKLITDFYLYKK